MSFSSQVSAFKKKALENATRIGRQSAFDLYSAITISTPVDTGLLRNNWFITLDIPTSVISGNDDEGAYAGIAEEMRQKLEAFKFGTTIFITNNLPYATRIEFDGWSWRKPEGMVRINTIRWASIVSNNVRKFAK